MKRRIFTLSVLLSLVLGITTVWWWSGSSRRVDQLSFERPGSQDIRIWGTAGKVLMTRTVYPPSKSSGAGQIAWNSTPSNPGGPGATDPKLTLASFSYANQPLADKPGGRETYLVLPAWLLTMTFAVLPMMWVATTFKNKKKPSK